MKPNEIFKTLGILSLSLFFVACSAGEVEEQTQDSISTNKPARTTAPLNRNQIGSSNRSTDLSPLSNISSSNNSADKLAEQQAKMQADKLELQKLQMKQNHEANMAKSRQDADREERYVETWNTAIMVQMMGNMAAAQTGDKKLSCINYDKASLSVTKIMEAAKAGAADEKAKEDKRLGLYRQSQPQAKTYEQAGVIVARRVLDDMTGAYPQDKGQNGTVNTPDALRGNR
jgi:hypothetical protein